MVDTLNETLIWRKASRSSNGQASCVEVARTEAKQVAVRDGKAPNDGVLRFAGQDWRRFMEKVQMGRFDLWGK